MPSFFLHTFISTNLPIKLILWKGKFITLLHSVLAWSWSSLFLDIPVTKHLWIDPSIFLLKPLWISFNLFWRIFNLSFFSSLLILSSRIDAGVPGLWEYIKLNDESNWISSISFSDFPYLKFRINGIKHAFRGNKFKYWMET